MTELWLGREDVTLRDALQAELPGILNWALDGLSALVRQGRFTEPASRVTWSGRGRTRYPRSLRSCGNAVTWETRWRRPWARSTRHGGRGVCSMGATTSSRCRGLDAASERPSPGWTPLSRATATAGTVRVFRGIALRTEQTGSPSLALERDGTREKPLSVHSEKAVQDHKQIPIRADNGADRVPLRSTVAPSVPYRESATSAAAALLPEPTHPSRFCPAVPCRRLGHPSCGPGCLDQGGAA